MISRTSHCAIADRAIKTEQPLLAVRLRVSEEGGIVCPGVRGDGGDRSNGGGDRLQRPSLQTLKVIRCLFEPGGPLFGTASHKDT